MSKLVDTSTESIKRTLQHHFGEIAQQANAEMFIYGLMGERLLERLEGLRLNPQTILDVGTGFGQHALALHQAFPKASVMAMEMALPMAKRADRRRGWWKKRFDVIVGDIETPPLLPGSVDLVFANATVLFSRDPLSWLRSLRSVLKPGGFVLISTLGPDTLNPQLQTLGVTHTPWIDVQQLGALLSQAGFNEPVLDTDWLQIEYASIDKLKKDLGELGLFTPMVLGLDQAIDFNAPALAETMDLSTTWECLFASAFAPDAGQTLTDADGSVASVPLSEIGIRRRR